MMFCQSAYAAFIWSLPKQNNAVSPQIYRLCLVSFNATINNHAGCGAINMHLTLFICYLDNVGAQTTDSLSQLN